MSDFFQIEAIKTKVDSKPYTTICAGGSFEYFAVVNDIESLKDIISYWQNYSGQNSKSLTVIGNGSNCIVNDKGVSGLVIKLGSGFKKFSKVTNSTFYLGAGCSLMQISRKLSMLGFSGLEFAGGIPGSVGGAVVMNAGAHGGEMSSIVSSVDVLLPNLEVCKIESSDLGFSYRHSNLPTGAIVLAATVELEAGDPDIIVTKQKECLRYRKETQPLTLPSFGSVFTNPDSLQLVGVRGGLRAAAQFIEMSGLKGRRIGGAEISSMHANWIVNPEKKATTSDINSLIELCVSTVKENFNVVLKPEVKYL